MKRFLFVFTLFLLLPDVARAACPAAPVGNAGDRVIQFVQNGDGLTAEGPTSSIDATEEGAVVYDAANDVLVVCDGTNWVPLGGGGAFIPSCKADMSSIKIGDACDDLSRFLGTHPHFGWQGFYVTNVDQSTSSDWSSANTLCNNLNRHGHTDWYLPSISELNVLYLNKFAIDGSYPPSSTNYWSSTRSHSTNSGYKYAQNLSNGNRSSQFGTTGNYVRCVRRGQ